MPASSASAATRLSGRRGARPDSRRRDQLGLAEPLGRKPDDEARNAAFAHQKVRADADDRQRHVFRHRLRKAARSSSSAGWNSASARPPARNQVILSISAFGVMPPAHAAQPSPSVVEQRLAIVLHAVCRQRRQFLRQRIGPLGDVAGAEEHDEVAGLGQLPHQRRDRRGPRCSARRDGRRSGCARPAPPSRRRRSAPRRPHRPAPRCTVSASLKQAQNSSNRSCSRVIAVRLGDRDDAARGSFARRPQHRLDLDRVMAVVVEDLDAVPCAGMA